MMKYIIVMKKKCPIIEIWSTHHVDQLVLCQHLVSYFLADWLLTADLVHDAKGCAHVEVSKNQVF